MRKGRVQPIKGHAQNRGILFSTTSEDLERLRPHRMTLAMGPMVVHLISYGIWLSTQSYGLRRKENVRRVDRPASKRMSVPDSGVGITIISCEFG